MAVQAYYNWVADGEPSTIALPIAQMRDRIRTAKPRVVIGTIGNRSTHLEVDYPQDHAPFSFTGWPVPHPYPYVAAMDLMHRPDRDVDCREFFDYWITECRVGRMPWVKYLIWEATLYDTRYGWKPQPNSDHFDHIHMSIRSDWVARSIGEWDPIPGRDDMTPEESRQLANIDRLLTALLLDTDDVTGLKEFPGDPTPVTYPLKIAKRVRSLESTVTQVKEELALLRSAIQTGTGVTPETLRAAVEAALREILPNLRVNV